MTKTELEERVGKLEALVGFLLEHVHEHSWENNINDAEQLTYNLGSCTLAHLINERKAAS